MYSYGFLTEEDREIIISFYEEFLNGGKGVRKHIEELMGNNNYIGIKCIDSEGLVCGIFSAYRGVEFTCGHLDLVQEIQYKYENRNIYTLDMMVVLPSHRNEGIAYELGLQLKKVLQSHRAELLMAELWRQPDGKLPGKVILDSIGHQLEHNYFPDFYEELERYELNCPICGVPCRCGADICILDLEYKSAGEIK